MSIIESTLEARRSVARPSGYKASTGNDLKAALAPPEWNCAVSAAFFEHLGDVEVVLRNALHDQLSLWHGNAAGRWYDDPKQLLTPQAQSDIAKARSRLSRRQA